MVSYLLQLLDDGHRQLTDIFTVWTSCLLLLSFSVGGTKLSFFGQRVSHFGFVRQSEDRAGNVWLHIEREIGERQTSLAPVDGPGKLSNPLRQTIARRRVEGSGPHSAHAPSASNVFTPSP